jgi:hypothetical protein
MRDGGTAIRGWGLSNLVGSQVSRSGDTGGSVSNFEVPSQRGSASRN